MNAHIVGAVLNRMPTGGRQGYYYYYYRYGYHYGSDNGQEKGILGALRNLRSGLRPRRQKPAAPAPSAPPLPATEEKP